MAPRRSANCHIFPFLELPPELRNIIYEISLRHDSNPGAELVASPALLCTCKQIYKEARGVLYNQSTLYLHARFVTKRGFLGTVGYKFQLDSGYGFLSDVRESSLIRIRDALPQHIFEVGTLVFNLELDMPGTLHAALKEDFMAELNRLLYVLACGYKGIRIRLVTRFKGFVDPDDEVQKALYPLAKLDQKLEVVVEGTEETTWMVRKALELRDATSRKEDSMEAESGELLKFNIVGEWFEKRELAALLSWDLENECGWDLESDRDANIVQDGFDMLTDYIDGIWETVITHEVERELFRKCVEMRTILDGRLNNRRRLTADTVG
ncbi:Hypothetical predicted protein [Lecanosticta acicola]|uniref:Uncharacterized protein n=1 Tax=Lecanosticta acicola TaxID=111012 RepID=A0AAI8Z3H2_9PEZI|nr:Hypothetical predicted protein [Lecanosticta acicola]